MPLSDYFASTESHRIELAPDAWVDIKSEMSVADRDELGTRLLQGSAASRPAANRAERRRRRNGDGDDDEVIDAASFRVNTVALLHINILDWSFCAEDGTKLPITEKNVSSLKPHVAQTLLTAINERNPLVPRGRRNTTTPSKDAAPL